MRSFVPDLTARRTESGYRSFSTSLCVSSCRTAEMCGMLRRHSGAQTVLGHQLEPFDRRTLSPLPPPPPSLRPATSLSLCLTAKRARSSSCHGARLTWEGRRLVCQSPVGSSRVKTQDRPGTRWDIKGFDAGHPGDNSRDTCETQGEDPRNAR